MKKVRLCIWWIWKGIVHFLLQNEMLNSEVLFLSELIKDINQCIKYWLIRKLPRGQCLTSYFFEDLEQIGTSLVRCSATPTKLIWACTLRLPQNSLNWENFDSLKNHLDKIHHTEILSNSGRMESWNCLKDSLRYWNKVVEQIYVKIS